MPIAKTTASIAGKTSLAALLGLVLLTSTGCMISPLDGHTVNSRYNPIDCLGATKNPNDMIHVEVWNKYTQKWDIAAHAYTGTSPVYSNGNTWYIWDKSIWIADNAYWRPAGNGKHYAVIRSRRFDGNDDWVGEELFSFATWEYEPNMSLKDFYEKHGTGTSHVTIYEN